MDADAYWDLISGILLNVDNAMLTACQAAVEAAMNRICNNSEDCSGRFDRDSMLGIDGMDLDKSHPDRLVIVGLINWGEIENQVDAIDGRGDVNSLRLNFTRAAGGVAAAQTNHSITAMETRINNVITEMLNDEQVRMCREGRDTTQITRSTAAIAARNNNNRTEARFPHIADSAAMEIASSGLARARENYTRRLTQLQAEAHEALAEMMKVQAQAGICYDPEIMGPLDMMAPLSTPAATPART